MIRASTRGATSRAEVTAGPSARLAGTSESGPEATRGTSVKLILAFIQPFKVDEVRNALRAAGVTGMSVSNVQGFGRQSGQTETYRGAEYTVDFVPKTSVLVLVDDDLVDNAVNAIEVAARTGTIGDGKIAVVPLDDVIRIRTGERGVAAL